MGIPSFFKTPQHRRFNYEPIYYDERKEKLEERIRLIEQEHGLRSGEDYVPGIGKGSLSKHFERKRKSKRYSSTRLIIIIIFLLFVSYYLFFV